MKLSKKIIVGLLFTSLNSSANEEISYDWFEVGYAEKKQGSFASGKALTLAGSFAINDKFYITADASRTRSDSLAYENSIGFSLGFHKALTQKTDFYTELGYRNNHPDNFESFDGAEFKVGTRSVLSPKFELITHIGYKDLDLENRPDNYRFSNSKGGLNFGIKALYKITKSSNISFGLSEEDSSISPSIGYRFNW